MRHPTLVLIYAAAMGVLEAIVVLYLRRLYYPAGFRFPLVLMDPAILRAEIIREAMTLIMLVTVSGLAGATAWSRLMAFLVAFGAWDLAYYAGLKIFLDWPTGLLTPDILFLIPKAWVGPVIAPVLVSLAWIIAGLALHRARYRDLRMGFAGWGLGLLASVLILISFLLPQGEPARPRFSWLLFGLGYAAGAIALGRLLWRARRVRRGRI